MDDKEMPEGLCRLGQIFWRVEAQGPEPSEDLKVILEEMRRKELKEKEKSYRLVSRFIKFNG